jgi:orotate phosphoribosyltransferase
MPENPQIDEISRLRDILCRNSVRFGSFELSSGQHTDAYVDAKLTTCSARAMQLVGRVFLAKMASRGWRPEAVGGLTIGADPIAFAIARESVAEGAPIDSFIVRKEAKKHGMQRFIEGIEDTRNKRVVIIDDVCTTGDSTARAIEQAIAAEMHVLGAVCLVDRQSGASERLMGQFGCQLESVFTLDELRSYRYGIQQTAEPVEASV